MECWETKYQANILRVWKFTSKSKNKKKKKKRKLNGAKQKIETKWNKWKEGSFSLPAKVKMIDEKSYEPVLYQR